MRDFYCKDCGALIGQVGDDDIVTKCPKCRSLNSSALKSGFPSAPTGLYLEGETGSELVVPVTADLGAKKLREIGELMGLSFAANVSKVNMANAINEAKK